jgi:arylsulfatase A-like enzyme
VSLGKVFHTPDDNADGWSDPAWVPSDIPFYQRAENMKLHAERLQVGEKPDRGPAWEFADLPDWRYEDGAIAQRAVDDLQRLSNQVRPFFLAVGFKKPHLPFVAPQKYWDLYDRSSISLPTNGFVPENAPAESIHTWGELRHYSGIPTSGPVSDETARNLIHGYYACASFVDAQVGRVLDELDALGLADDTIVMLWGDHGWNLGEHTLWCKHSCYEVSLRVPLLVRVPGIAGNTSTRGLTELIDLYPTLCELAGIPQPEHLQGVSFVPLLSDPTQSWKPAVFGRFKKGDTVRTNRYRFSQFSTETGTPISNMMYDHALDPNENKNIVADSSSADSVALHARMLDQMLAELASDAVP